MMIVCSPQNLLSLTGRYLRLLNEINCTTGLMSAFGNLQSCPVCYNLSLATFGLPVIRAGFVRERNDQDLTVNERSANRFSVERRRISPGMLYRNYALGLDDF